MFENIRDKIQTVQADISSSLSSFAIGSTDKKMEKHKLLKICKKIPNLNLEAGFNLLAWDEQVWKDSHCQCEQNASLAEKIGNKLNFLETFSNRYQKSIQEFINQMDNLKLIEDGIDWVMEDIQICERYINQLKSLLLKLEEEKEKKCLKQFEFDLNYQLINYKERKNSEFETLKVKLSSDHFKKMKEFEKEEQIKLKMRQKIFQAAFEKELNDYKTYGKVETKINQAHDRRNVKVKSLEEIEIEPDEDDQTALSQFLNDEAN